MNIREAIELVRHLYEMPYLFSADFELDNPSKNRETLDHALRNSVREIGMESGHRLMLSDFGSGKGAIFTVDQSSGMLTYYMKYASLQHKKLGKTVVQTAVWRSSDNRVKRLPQTVLFNILLRLFDTVLSDKHHTPDGQNFWKRLMLIAAQRGLTIGLIDGEDITIYQSGDVMRWIDSLDAWSDDDEYEKKRLFITKRRGAEHQ